MVPKGAPEARQVGVYLANAVAASAGLGLQIVEADRPSVRRGAIVLTLTGPRQDSANPESYELEVTERGVLVQAPGAAGLFYGVRTLLALFPPEIEGQARGEAS